MAAIVVRIRRIPRGSVQTYGGIDPEAPRLVGRVLATTHQDLPWHRVVRADGSLSQGQRQRELLVEEGVPMRGDRVDMKLARRKHLSEKETVAWREATQAQSILRRSRSVRVATARRAVSTPPSKSP